MSKIVCNAAAMTCNNSEIEGEKWGQIKDSNAVVQDSDN